MRLLFTKVILCAAIFTAAFGAFTAEELDLPALPPPGGEVPAADAAELPAPPQPGGTDTTLLLPPATPDTAGTAETGGLLMPPPLPESAPDSTTPEPAASEIYTVTIAPAAPEGGVSGSITGGRVHIRAGDSTKYEIITTANPGTPVTVFEKIGDWVKIAYPETEYCYIDRQFVDGDIPADIPEQGLVRTIKGEKVNVRARPWPGSTVVGQVNSGDTVIVNGMRSQWARVRPPAAARGWVFYKYVSYDSSGVKETAATPADADAESLRAAADTIKDKIATSSKNDVILGKIRQRAEQERKQREMYRKNTQRILEGLEDQLARIDQEAQSNVRITYERAERQKEAVKEDMQQIEDNYRPGPPPGSMGGQASGWVSYLGYIGGRPAGYRLTKGGETQYLLRSLRYNLDDFIGKRVLVNGDVKPAPAWEADVMTVTRLSLFDDPQRTIDTVEVVREPLTAIQPETSVTVDEPIIGTRRVVIDVTGLE